MTRFLASSLMIICWSASVAASDYTLSGVACQTLNANTAKFGWKPEGAVNKDPLSDRWAICPVLKNNNATQLTITVGLLNEDSFASDVRCWLRQRVDGRQTAQAGGIVSVDGRAFSKEMFFQGNFDENASLTVQCKLPPAMIIEYVRSEDADGPDGPDGNEGSTDVVACITSPEGDFSSSSATVIMRNGMQVNNYDGRRFESDDRHLIFRTNSNAWYTIENYDKGGELYRLDVTQEPTSCFEPDAGSFETPTRVEAFNSDIRVYVDGGYIVVGSTCGVTTSSLLTAFDAGFLTSTFYLVDVNTGEDCLIKDIVET